MTEEWRDIPGFGGHYAASNLGNVKVKRRAVAKRSRWGGSTHQIYRERVLGGTINRDGHVLLHLGFDGAKVRVPAHRLIALAFHGPCPDGQECRHLNGIPSDNRPENLAWGTHLENNQDRVRHGTYPRGQDHPMAKHSAELLADIIGGRVGLAEAMRCGVSRTHFYRVRRNAEAMRLADETQGKAA